MILTSRTCWELQLRRIVFWKRESLSSCQHSCDWSHKPWTGPYFLFFDVITEKEGHFRPEKIAAEVFALDEISVTPICEVNEEVMEQDVRYLFVLLKNFRSFKLAYTMLPLSVHRTSDKFLFFFFLQRGSNSLPEEMEQALMHAFVRMYDRTQDL